MFATTMPIATSPDALWLFATTERDCQPARLAITTAGTLLALPVDDFDTGGLLPIWPETGEPIPQLRWAATTDTLTDPGVFETH